MSGYRDLAVDHACPQCGGPVSLLETDRIFTCGFCRVRLYITARGCLRYLLQCPPQPERLLLVPYWRLRGMRFRLRPFDVTSKVLDSNFIANDLDFLPPSIGLRAQALRLRFASSEADASFLPATTELSDVVSTAEQVVGAVEQAFAPAEYFHRAFIGETVSMIYAPFYVKGRGIYDAVLQRPIASYTSLRAGVLGKTDGKKFGVDFLPALCPSCGWDLEGGRNSVVLLCRNCSSAWRVEAGKFTRQASLCFNPRRRGLYYMPFWMMKARVEGLSLSTYADLVKIANLPRVVTAGLEKKELYFWAPAFKCSPMLYLRLSKQMTLMQPDEGLSEELPQSDVHPVTIGHMDAAGGLKVILGALSGAKRRLFPELENIEMEPMDATLVFVPFRETANEYVHEPAGFCVLKKSIR